MALGFRIDSALAYYRYYEDMGKVRTVMSLNVNCLP